MANSIKNQFNNSTINNPTFVGITEELIELYLKNFQSKDVSEKLHETVIKFAQEAGWKSTITSQGTIIITDTAAQIFISEYRGIKRLKFLGGLFPLINNTHETCIYFLSRNSKMNMAHWEINEINGHLIYLLSCTLFAESLNAKVFKIAIEELDNEVREILRAYMMGEIERIDINKYNSNRY